jgi:hypothetical protein
LSCAAFFYIRRYRPQTAAIDTASPSATETENI